MTLLLALSLFFVPGVTKKTFATEKLTIFSSNETKKVSVCNSPLQYILVVSNDKCEIKNISQRDLVARLESKNRNLMTYATEPTRFDGQASLAPTATVQTSTIAPTVTPIDPQNPTSNLGANGNNNNSDAIFEMINAHRAKIGKAAFIKDSGLCSLAATRSLELHGELFEGKGYLHSGLYNRNLPYWITENAKYGSNETGTVQWWLNSPIHRRAIEGDYTYSCGACNGTQCSQLFTSYTPKGNSTISKSTQSQPLAAAK